MCRISIIITLTVFFLLSCEKKRTPERYLVPVGYNGILVTIFDQEGYPNLPLEDGFIVHDYPSSGIIITSSSEEIGWASDQTIDRFEDGRTTILPSHHTDKRSLRFSGSGSKSGGDGPEYNYYFCYIGDDNYWKDKDAKEVDKKIKEAIKLIQSSRN